MSKLYKELKYDTDRVMQPGDPLTSPDGQTKVKANNGGTAALCKASSYEVTLTIPEVSGASFRVKFTEATSGGMESFTALITSISGLANAVADQYDGRGISVNGEYWGEVAVMTTDATFQESGDPLPDSSKRMPIFGGFYANFYLRSPGGLSSWCDWSNLSEPIETVEKEISIEGHTHSASNITSGVLPIAFGGTGVNGTSQGSNKVLASPSTGSSGTIAFRSLVAADIPNLNTSKLTAGTLGVARGGTGKSSHTINSVIIGGTSKTGALQNVAAASGAFYSTGTNVKPQFGTLPVAQGGTGATNSTQALTNLGAMPVTASASDISSGASGGATIRQELDTINSTLTAKADLVDGKVPSTQLPSYVDDVLEYASRTAFPATGESGKIYVDTSTNKTYRWSGSKYIEIAASPNFFGTITVGGSSVVADSVNDTLTISACSGVSVYANPSTDTINISLDTDTYNRIPPCGGYMEKVWANAGGAAEVASGCISIYGSSGVTTSAGGCTLTISLDSDTCTKINGAVQGVVLENAGGNIDLVDSNTHVATIPVMFRWVNFTGRTGSGQECSGIIVPANEEWDSLGSYNGTLNIYASNGVIVYDYGSNGLNFDVAGDVPRVFNTNCGSAYAYYNQIYIQGCNGISTSSPDNNSCLYVNLDAFFNTDSGSIGFSSGCVDIHGCNGISTTACNGAIVVSLDPVIATDGGCAAVNCGCITFTGRGGISTSTLGSSTVTIDLNLTVNADCGSAAVSNYGSINITGCTSVVTNASNGTVQVRLSNQAEAVIHGAHVFHATSTTASGIAIKQATISSPDWSADHFALTPGTRVHVKFSAASTDAAPQLNINSTEAKSIYYNGAVTSTTNPFKWSAGTEVDFVYDGVGWCAVGVPTHYYAICSTTANTQAKVATVQGGTGFVLTSGTMVDIRFNNANTATSPTLALTGLTAFSICDSQGIALTASSVENWAADDLVGFVFNYNSSKSAYQFQVENAYLARKINVLNILSTNATTIALKSDTYMYKVTDSGNTGTFPTLTAPTDLPANCYYKFEMEWVTASPTATYAQTASTTPAMKWISSPVIQTDGLTHTYHISGRYDTTTSTFWMSCWKIDDAQGAITPDSHMMKYLLTTPEQIVSTTTNTNDTITVQLSDHAINTVQVPTTATNVVMKFPGQAAGKARDFMVRLVVTGETVPSITLTEPDGSAVEFDVDDDSWTEIEQGVNLLMFTETAQ